MKYMAKPTRPFPFRVWSGHKTSMRAEPLITFTIRNYLSGSPLYYYHLCQKGRDNVIEEELCLFTTGFLAPRASPFHRRTERKSLKLPMPMRVLEAMESQQQRKHPRVTYTYYPPELRAKIG